MRRIAKALPGEDWRRDDRGPAVAGEWTSWPLGGAFPGADGARSRSRCWSGEAITAVAADAAAFFDALEAPGPGQRHRKPRRGRRARHYQTLGEGVYAPFAVSIPKDGRIVFLNATGTGREAAIAIAPRRRGADVRRG